jgi:hypothetical protein
MFWEFWKKRTADNADYSDKKEETEKRKVNGNGKNENIGVRPQPSKRSLRHVEFRIPTSGLPPFHQQSSFSN